MANYGSCLGENDGWLAGLLVSVHVGLAARSLDPEGVALADLLTFAKAKLSGHVGLKSITFYVQCQCVY